MPDTVIKWAATFNVEDFDPMNFSMARDDTVNELGHALADEFKDRATITWHTQDDGLSWFTILGDTRQVVVEVLASVGDQPHFHHEPIPFVVFVDGS